MEKIPAEFLEDAFQNLSEILDELRRMIASGNTSLPNNFSRKLFRALHTIKGSAQTFGLDSEAQVAHEAEGFLQSLQDGRARWNAECGILLTGTLETLANNFKLISEGKGGNSTVDLIRELKAMSGKTDDEKKDLPLPENFPAEFSDKLSVSETEKLGSAWDTGKEILILEFSIGRENFAAEFSEIRNKLDGAAEVIAVASGTSQTLENITICRFLAASENSTGLTGVMREFGGRVLFQKHKKTGKESAGLGDVENEISGAILHGKKAAEIAGKNVKILTAGDDIQIPAQLSKTVSLVLLHLVRNAVDHGIEFPLERAALKKPANGTVEIAINISENDLRIEVCDDGRGIEDESKIFAAGYTTAPFVTGLSGRGVGLDAVLDAVKKAGGTIKVESTPGHGTKFKIDLPLREK